MSNGTRPYQMGAQADSGTAYAVDLGNPRLNQVIADGMVDVERVLQEELSKGEEFISEKVLHLVSAGGKRFRPMFALLASQYGSRPGCSAVVRAAVVVEMTHLATLYHDDVMDEADRRRGVPSANFRWNNSVAILAGDYLLAHASRLMAELGVQTVAHFADTFGASPRPRAARWPTAAGSPSTGA